MFSSFLLVLSLSSPGSSSSGKHVLSCHGGPSYRLELSKDDLIYHEGLTLHRLRKTACNAPLLEGFWKAAEASFARLPLVRGGNLEKVAHVEMKGQKRLLATVGLPGTRDSHFEILPKKFLSLMGEERAKCRR